MSDPVFTTRAELVAWARQLARSAGAQAKAKGYWQGEIVMDALETIKRVTLAHAHLEDDYGTE